MKSYSNRNIQWLRVQEQRQLRPRPTVSYKSVTQKCSGIAHHARESLTAAGTAECSLSCSSSSTERRVLGLGSSPPNLMERRCFVCLATKLDTFCEYFFRRHLNCCSCRRRQNQFPSGEAWRVQWSMRCRLSLCRASWYSL